MENIFRVSGNTNSKKLASALMKAIQNNENVSVRCLGAASINQAIKAFCILRGMGAEVGLDVSYYSVFDMEYKNDDNLTFIKFYLQIKNAFE